MQHAGATVNEMTKLDHGGTPIEQPGIKLNIMCSGTENTLAECRVPEGVDAKAVLNQCTSIVGIACQQGETNFKILHHKFLQYHCILCSTQLTVQAPIILD